MNYIAALLLIGKTIEKNFFLLEYKQLATTVSRATSLQSLEYRNSNYGNFCRKLDVEQQAIVEESSSSSISEEEISKEKEEAERERADFKSTHATYCCRE